MTNEQVIAFADALQRTIERAKDRERQEREKQRKIEQGKKKVGFDNILN
jgi:hypothetical protein